MRKQLNLKGKTISTLVLLFAFVLVGSFYATGAHFNTPIPDHYGDEPTMPTYKGGNEAMGQFMVDNIKYPKDAIKEGISGTVYVKLVIKKDGSVSDVTVKKGVHKLLDDEAVRVIKMMPKWNPGKKNGKVVDVEIVLPVKFKLDDKKKE